MKKLTYSPLQRSPTRIPQVPVTSFGLLLPKKGYRRLELYRKAEIRLIPQGEKTINSKTLTKRANSVTTRTLSPISFLQIGKAQNKQSNLTLLFQQKAVISEIREIKPENRENCMKKEEIEAKNRVKMRYLREKRNRTFSLLGIREEKRGSARRRETILPDIRKQWSRETILGPW